MQFRLLGPLEVVEDATPIQLGGAKQRAVLAHLLLRANRVVPAERLIDEVWEDDPPAAARNVLQTYVSRLRKALGDERLERRSGGYVLHADPAEVDTERFGSLAAEARRRAAVDPAAAIELYREADGLWRGPALDDLADQPSLRGHIAQLEELRTAAEEDRIVAELSLGRHAELVPELENLTALHPLRETPWAHLITALYRSGRQADALAAYRRARAVLVEELGLEPSAGLRQLEQQVLQHDPELEIAGRSLRGFRLLEKVGEGAFGVVHRAVQPQVAREVAVKVVRPVLANDPEFIRRFEAEARLVARLEHPHIVPLYDYWREPDGAFLVMRFLRGGSLREALAGGPLPLDAALLVVEHVGAALASAHRQGVVHRDVKPGNILFDEERNAYLSDFGIARDVSTALTPDRAAATTTSADYVSPEEIRGELPSARADVYSLGRVLAAMVGAQLPGGVEEIVRRATAADPEERYPDASAMVAALADAARSGVRAVAVPAGPARNPYKGLRPFLEPDAPDFHGRESLVGRLAGRLRGDDPGTRLVALVGPSGSGKSSVVRAGLVPAVRAGSPRVFVAEMTPGEDPFAELAAALVGLASAAPPSGLAGRLEAQPESLAGLVAGLLPDEASELLLVVDQFEELFTVVADEARRTAFMAALRAAAAPGSRVRVVLTLRADVLDRPLAHAGFAEVLQAGTELVVPMGAGDLERAISGPARRAGVAVEPALLAELVSDTIGQPGALPLLQFALAELFDRRTDGTLTLAAYRELGGVGGGVARGAEAVFGALDAPGRELARQLFLRLVDPDAGMRGSRRRVLRSELDSLADDAAGMERVVAAFAARRLLSFDRDPETREPTVEIAHDALLEAWDRPREWLEVAREDLRTQRRLASAARDWSDAGRDASFLLRGARLEQLERWREASDLALTPLERGFLAASLAERDRRRDEEAARRARERQLERRSLRRLRALAGVLAGAALVAVALTLFAFGQRADAERERRTAVARGFASAAVANLEVDAELSVLLALEAVDHTRAADGSVLPEAEDALHRAVGASRIVLRVPGVGGALDWSPDGRLFATEGPEESGLVDIRDATTGRSVRKFRGHDADVNLVAFSGDGTMLATSGDDGAVNVWNPDTGDRLQRFAGQGDQVWGLSFSRDGTLLAAAAWAEETVRIWDVRTGRPVRAVRSVPASFTTSFSPDGRRLAIPTFGQGAIVVDVRSGDVVFELGREEVVSDVDWSPDGRWIATSTFDGTVSLWNARTGRFRTTLFGHRGEVVAADWSADSRRLATGSNDGTAKVWAVDAAGARELLSISAQERGGGLWVAFSPDGRRLMTGDQGISAVKVWDVSRTGPAEWANVPAAETPFGDVAFTADGREVVAANRNGSLAIWDASTGARKGTLPWADAPDAESTAIAAARGGAVAAAAGEAIRTWDLATRRPGFGMPSPGGALDVAWSHDGRLLAMASGEGAARILDRSGKEVATLRVAAGHRVSAVVFSPDARQVATAGITIERPGSGTDAVSIWDWRRNRVVRTLRTTAGAVAFSPDGTRVATAALFGPVRIWDARSGRTVERLVGHNGAVNDVAFAPDGSLVATASADGTVRLWDPATGRQALVLRGHGGAVSGLAFSPDGSRLASTGPEGVVRIWALDLDDLVTIARRKLTRSMTGAECRQYLRDRRCGQ